MKTVMSIAAGLAIGYFLYQFLVKNGGVKTTGRLHKSSGNKMLAGVCGGIAEFLNTDPTYVRLAVALLCLGWGSGIVVYIVAALVLPTE